MKWLQRLLRPKVVTNWDHLRSLEAYEFAVAILNLGEEPCLVGPRLAEERCDDDCDNCIVEWLMQPYDPNSIVWRDNW